MFEGLGFKMWNYDVEFDDIGTGVYQFDDDPNYPDDPLFIDEFLESSFTWSDELALAASMYLKDLEGCNVYQPVVIDDGQANDYLS